VLSPQLAPKFAGIERADSIAMDFHKWMHVPYDAGFILVRSAQWQVETFADLNQSYWRASRRPVGRLALAVRPGAGPVAGISRPQGVDEPEGTGRGQAGQAMAESCERAQYLAARIAASPSWS
jgi:aromatic-L-amino-acid decarboxylase